MLKIVGSAVSDCSGATRRNFLQAGVLGGLSVAGLHRLRAEASEGRRDTAVILFWLSGGPGHMETWDPKPEAVREFRGPFGAIRARVSGVQFGELLPERHASRTNWRSSAASTTARAITPKPIMGCSRGSKGRTSWCSGGLRSVRRRQAPRSERRRDADLCRSASPP